jgi:diphosphomevalonate decarboxylase
MYSGKATAVSCSNIAFIKYWGNRDPVLRLPNNDSLSMNLSAAMTTTTVELDASLTDDRVVIQDREVQGDRRARVVQHLDRVRAMAGIETRARVTSVNSFPMATGIASSASAFAALSLAATAAAGLRLNERELSCLARLGSGSACRSVPAGFTYWHAGHSHETSYAESIAGLGHWDLRDLVAVVSTTPKAVGSADGHSLAPTSLFYAARLAVLPGRLQVVKAALLARDLVRFGETIEAEATELHVIAMTSRPPIIYWLPETLAVMQAVRDWRAEGLLAYFTLDAGANVHVICLADDAPAVEQRLTALPAVIQVIACQPGDGVRLQTFAQTSG